MLRGQEYRVGGEDRVPTLLELYEESHGVIALDFPISSREAFSFDYIYKMFGRTRQLRQFARPSGDIVEIRIPAINRQPDGG